MAEAERSEDSPIGTQVPRTFERSLVGSLPCVVCGYELQGLSIRSVCPECGTAIRATILYTVDPAAEELRPMLTPRLTAVSLVMWSVLALLATLASWIPRLVDAARRVNEDVPSLTWTGPLAIIAAAGSGLCVIGLIRPTRETRIGKSICAGIAALAYIPLVWLLAQIQSFDESHRTPYFDAVVHADRARMHFLLCICIVVALLGLRPNLRDLVKRSLALRTGRVDRQTIYGMAAVAGICAVGDLLRLLSLRVRPGVGQVLEVAGSLTVAGASLLLTLGLVSAIIDSWRISRAILIPPPTLKTLVGEGNQPPPGSAQVPRS